MDEFCKLFEPTIVRRSSSAGTMDIDDLMKEVRRIFTECRSLRLVCKGKGPSGSLSFLFCGRQGGACFPNQLHIVYAHAASTNCICAQTFSGILMDAKLERSVVIQGFMKAFHDIEKSGRGFGKAYWGSKWRFKIFDGFYTHPKNPETGVIVDVALRFHHLMERLEKATKVFSALFSCRCFASWVFGFLTMFGRQGEDSWLNLQFEKDEDIMREVKDKEIVKEYCKLWLDVLKERAKEVMDAQVARTAAPCCGMPPCLKPWCQPLRGRHLRWIKTHNHGVQAFRRAASMGDGSGGE